MHPRETPRTIPDLPHYYDVQLTDALRVTFRTPSPVVFAKLARVVPPEVLGALLVARKGDLRSVFAVQDKLPALVSLLGAVVGLAWHDADRDLDADVDALGFLAFGDAVVEELHEAGVGAVQVVNLATAILAEILGDLATAKEASETIPFSVARRGSRTSSPSTSG
jgi:hypothetical protein